MLAIAFDVLPIFLLILIGWAIVRSGLLAPVVGDHLGDFVFRIAVPVLLFRTIAEAEFHGQSPWKLWVAYFAGVAVTWTAGHLALTRLFGRDRRLGVLAGVCSAFANNVFIGLPLVQRIVGDEGVVALSILLSVHLPAMMMAGTILMDRAEKAETGEAPQSVLSLAKSVLGNLVHNPLVVGLVLGALCHGLGLRPLGPVKTVVDQISAMAGPAALISLGMALRKYGVSDGVRPALVTTAFKLFLLPASVYVAATLMGLDARWVAALVLTASVPTGVNAWLIANHFGVGHGLASSTITLTTAIGVASVTLWAYWLQVAS